MLDERDIEDSLSIGRHVDYYRLEDARTFMRAAALALVDAHHVGRSLYVPLRLDGEEVI
jgi:hypothetical protein